MPFYAMAGCPFGNLARIFLTLPGVRPQATANSATVAPALCWPATRCRISSVNVLGSSSPARGPLGDCSVHTRWLTSAHRKPRTS